MSRVLGLDVGGANLKAATADGAAVERPFPLWKRPGGLADALRSLVAQFPGMEGLALTMTGELADGYASKAEGVRAIVAAAVVAAQGRPVRVWGTDGAFVTPTAAAQRPTLVAAANWHSLATFAGRLVPQGPGLLIDVGSTTTDLIPLRDGRVAAVGRTDLGRLQHGELVYTGATRTPLCALGPAVTLNGRTLPLAAEFFATTRDVHLLLGDLPEEAADIDTADGRPATAADARRRLARMLCSDPDEVGEGPLLELAGLLAARQRETVAAAVDGLLDRIDGTPHVLLSGGGAWLAERVVSQTPRLAEAAVTSLSERFGPAASRAACAYAVARLAAERGADFTEPDPSAPGLSGEDERVARPAL